MTDAAGWESIRDHRARTRHTCAEIASCVLTLIAAAFVVLLSLAFTLLAAPLCLLGAVGSFAYSLYSDSLGGALRCINSCLRFLGGLEDVAP